MFRLLRNNLPAGDILVTLVLFVFAILALLRAVRASAVEVQPPTGKAVPCAVMEDSGGEVEILDPSRTTTIEAGKNTGIPCGGSVSIGKGWALIQHRDGYEFHVGSQSFLEFPETNPDGNFSGDAVVLYRGQVYAEVGGGMGQLRIVTANARARTDRGTIIAVYDRDQEETQLISLAGSGSIENRFEPSETTQVKQGESSSLNFKLLRVLPTPPSAVSVASLRPKLNDLHIPANDKALALQTAHTRADRKFAIEMNSAKKHRSGGRSLASVSSPTYARHRYSKNDAYLRAYMLRKLVAGQQVGEQILYPDKFYGRPQKVRVEVEDPEACGSVLRSPGYYQKVDAEKRRLIEELSKIRAD